jgi:hypothetical protein
LRLWKTKRYSKKKLEIPLNHLNPKLNPICHLLALLGVHFLHVSRIRFKSLNHSRPSHLDRIMHGPVTKYCNGKGKGKAIPLQTWRGPEDSRRLRLPDIKTIGT